MQTVLITGGTGLLGNRLSALLTDKGYKVIHLSRKRRLSAKYPAYKWDIEKGEIDEAALQQADYIITLAGAGIADKRWTEKRKQLIIDSRVNGLLLIKQQLAAKNLRPKAIIGASAIGFYGDSGQGVMTENSPSGNDFLAESVRLWEGAYDAMEAALNVRVVRLRIGVILSPNGGALAKMLPTYKVGVGTYFGNGSQIYSWIHLDDMCAMFLFAVQNEALHGTYNGVAPKPVSNKTLAIAIGKALKRPTLPLPAPAFAMKLALGEMSAVVLSSSNVSAKKIQAAGFSFQFSDVKEALEDLLEK